MTPTRSITIVGGGLSGLTLGIALRQRGVRVAIREAGHYPRHRVCGEFISGRGQEVLGQLELRTLIEQAGAVWARSVTFFARDEHSPRRPLPVPALCLSRFTLDALLAAKFQELGGELHSGARWTESAVREGLVRATGRRAETGGAGGQWIGLKAHARGVKLDADLEMHVSDAGYVGVCVTSGGAVNVCGLFRSWTRSGSGSRPGLPWLRGEPGSQLHERLGRAEFDEKSFTAVAGLSLRPQRAAVRDECCIGDAVTMIPPVTGNGMSMAFEAAQMAVEPLVNYHAGGATWDEARQEVARRCDSTFAGRLAWARWLQWLMFSPLARTSMAGVLMRSEWLWSTLFARTR